MSDALLEKGMIAELQRRHLIKAEGLRVGLAWKDAMKSDGRVLFWMPVEGAVVCTMLRLEAAEALCGVLQESIVEMKRDLAAAQQPPEGGEAA